MQRLSAIEPFPAALATVYPEDFLEIRQYLSPTTLHKLREIDRQLVEQVDFAFVLEQWDDLKVQNQIHRMFQTAVEYFVEASILIWRGLEHDYEKLRRLARSGTKALEQRVLQSYPLLRKRALVDTLASLRVLARVGEWLTYTDEGTPPSGRVLPVKYFVLCLVGSFLTSCLIAYAVGGARKARRTHVTACARTLMSVARSAYKEALKQRLYEPAGEQNPWYWSPSWQQGEAEADLDKTLGKVHPVASIRELLEDLQGP